MKKGSSLCFVLCFDIGWPEWKGSDPLKSMPVIHRGSLLEQVREENWGEGLDNQGPNLQNILQLSYDNAVITIDFLRYDSIAKL